MNHLTLAVLVVVTTLLSACSAPTTIHDQSVLIEWYGDSTTNGVTFVNNEYIKLENSEANIVGRMLAQKFPGRSITVRSLGAGGTTAAQLLNGIVRYKNTFEKQMKLSSADIVIINFGINDAYTPNYSSEKFGNDIQSLVSSAKRHGKRIILETPNPINKEHNQKLWAFQNQIVVTGSKNDVPVISQWGEMMNNPSWRKMLSDEIHPTQEGYNIKAAVSIKVIDKEVRRVIKNKAGSN